MHRGDPAWLVAVSLGSQLMGGATLVANASFGLVLLIGGEGISRAYELLTLIANVSIVTGWATGLLAAVLASLARHQLGRHAREQHPSLAPATGRLRMKFHHGPGVSKPVPVRTSGRVPASRPAKPTPDLQPTADFGWDQRVKLARTLGWIAVGVDGYLILFGLLIFWMGGL